VKRYAPEIVGALLGAGAVVLAFRVLAERRLAEGTVAGLFRINQTFAREGRTALDALPREAQLRVYLATKGALEARGLEPATVRMAVQEAARVSAALDTLRRTFQVTR
jgi:hypothetical protein